MEGARAYASFEGESAWKNQEMTPSSIVLSYADYTCGVLLM